jgi:hypothetical protein
MKKFRKMSIVTLIVFLLVLNACAPIESARIEDMKTDDRKFLLETKTDEELCRAFINYYIKPLTARQIALILGKRGIKKCGAGSAIKLIPNENDDSRSSIIKETKVLQTNESSSSDTNKKSVKTENLQQFNSPEIDLKPNPNTGKLE